MSAISRAFVTIKRAIRAAGDQLSLGYRKHAVWKADLDSPPPLSQHVIECYDLLRERAGAAVK